MAQTENKLTNIALKALKLANVGETVSDGGGLMGKVRKVGDEVLVGFFYRYRFGERTRDFTIGAWPALSLKEIRAARNAARTLVASGVDPVEKASAEKSANTAAQVQAKADAEAADNRLRVRGLFDRWSQSDLATRKDKGAETIRGFNKDVLPVIGNRYADEIRRADVMSLLDAVVARGTLRLANRLLAEIRQMWNYGLVRELVTVDCTLGIKKKDVGGSDNERERVLSESELKALPAALKSAQMNDATVHALYLVLGTSVRIGELIQARKANIDLENRVWRIPSTDSKNTDAHIIYLSDFAAFHLQKLMMLSRSEIFLMPGRAKDETETHIDLKSITKQVADRQVKFFDRPAHAKRTRNENALVLGDENWTPHDLRRTSATLMQAVGVLPDVIDRCLNHRDENRIRRIYQRHDYANEKREAWVKLGARLEAVFTSNVLLGHFQKAG